MKVPLSCQSLAATSWLPLTAILSDISREFLSPAHVESEIYQLRTYVDGRDDQSHSLQLLIAELKRIDMRMHSEAPANLESVIHAMESAAIVQPYDRIVKTSSSSILPKLARSPSKSVSSDDRTKAAAGEFPEEAEQKLIDIVAKYRSDRVKPLLTASGNLKTGLDYHELDSDAAVKLFRDFQQAAWCFTGAEGLESVCKALNRALSSKKNREASKEKILKALEKIQEKNLEKIAVITVPVASAAIQQYIADTPAYKLSEDESKVLLNLASWVGYYNYGGAAISALAKISLDSPVASIIQLGPINAMLSRLESIQIYTRYSRKHESTSFSADSKFKRVFRESLVDKARADFNDLRGQMVKRATQNRSYPKPTSKPRPLQRISLTDYGRRLMNAVHFVLDPTHATIVKRTAYTQPSRPAHSQRCRPAGKSSEASGVFSRVAGFFK